MNIGRVFFNGVPLGGTVTEALMSPYLYHAEDQTTNNCHTQNIRYGITTTETVPRLAYQMHGCSVGSRQ